MCLPPPGMPRAWPSQGVTIDYGKPVTTVREEPLRTTYSGDPMLTPNRKPSKLVSCMGGCVVASLSSSSFQQLTSVCMSPSYSLTPGYRATQGIVTSIVGPRRSSELPWLEARLLGLTSDPSRHYDFSVLPPLRFPDIPPAPLSWYRCTDTS